MILTIRHSGKVKARDSEIDHWQRARAKGGEGYLGGHRNFRAVKQLGGDLIGG